MACSVAIEVPLAAKAGPTGEDGEGYDLAFGEGRIGTGSPFWWLGVAKVVNHNVECGEEGVHVEHEGSVPFPLGSVSKPTLACGHLPLKSSTYNSHQAFKEGTMEVLVDLLFYANVTDHRYSFRSNLSSL